MRVDPDKPTCAGTRKDGQPCEAAALPDSAFCFAHCPTRKVERDAGRSKGGRNRANVVRMRGLVPPRLVGVYDTLEEALGRTYEGSIPASRATAMATLARAMVAVLTAGEMEERLRDIESHLEEQTEADRWQA